MESFKIYLPSNACYSLYPKNSSSDYKTRLDYPIVLDGEYEVGVESIFYSSQIEAKRDEKAQVFCTALAADGSSLDCTVNVYPWRFKTIKRAMKHVNRQVKSTLRRNLKRKYDDKIHEFVLSHSSFGYSKLITGSKLKAAFSNNLHNLFGLSKSTLQHPQSYGTRHVSNLINTDQQLFLLSNIAKPTAYGQDRLQILQTFVYEGSKKTVIEKRFQPITYLPLMTNNIDMIQLQITNVNYEPVLQPDFTTIVCLYFRKAKSS